MNYLTGKGFLGNALLEKIDAIHIPHEEIDTFEPKDFDRMFFCSAYGNMSDHTDTDNIIKANLLDLITIINKVKDLNFKSFVYISTSSVKLPVQTMYSRTKKAAEEILMAYIEKYNLPITIIRPYSIIGSGEQNKHLIPTLIRAAINDTPVNLCSGSHDYIDVSDVVGGVLNLSDHQAKGIFELGSGVSVTNEKVLEIIEFITQKKLKVTQVPQLRKYDTPNWVCTNFKARGWGWLPTKSIFQSIEEEYDKIRKESY